MSQATPSPKILEKGYVRPEVRYAGRQPGLRRRGDDLPERHRRPRAHRGCRFEGEGCTISQAAASMLMEKVHEGRLTMPQVLALDYNAMIDALGAEMLQ